MSSPPRVTVRAGIAVSALRVHVYDDRLTAGPQDAIAQLMDASKDTCGKDDASAGG